MSKQISRDLLVADFDYDLPPELIAQVPLADRDASRLMVLDRSTGFITHSTIMGIRSWLEPGDLLVVNNTRVLPARLFARKRDTGGRIEFLLLRHEGNGVWTALARPTRKMRPGLLLDLVPTASDGSPAPISIEEIGSDGEVTVRFPDRADLRLDDYGEAPLPPYIYQHLDDANRYQTVYAKEPGSAAAPTAGLHFTRDLIERLRQDGIGWAEVTLHIGLDTFRPITVAHVEQHVIHQERCMVTDVVAKHIARTRKSGHRVVAVGTTAARTLETLGRAWDPDNPTGIARPTDIFITPGYTWRVVDALLTNFHLPRSTLLMMVSALAGRELILRAYAEAIASRYRFFSFGDAMLIV